MSPKIHIAAIEYIRTEQKWNPNLLLITTRKHAYARQVYTTLRNRARYGTLFSYL